MKNYRNWILFALWTIGYAHAADVAPAPMAVKIDKITLAVSESKLKTCVAFYSKALGAELKSFEVQGKTLYSGSLGGLELLLCPKELAGISATENTIQLRFVVKSVSSVMAAGLANGGTRIHEFPTASRTADIRDPDGNSIELTEGGQ